MSGNARPQNFGESDWDEQDLLTIDEASERLEGELAAIDRQIAGLTDEDGAGLRSRRQALAITLQNIKAGPTDLARID